MQKNGKLYRYPIVLDTKKGGLSLLFIYVKYNASSAYMPYAARALCLMLQGPYMHYSASALYALFCKCLICLILQVHYCPIQYHAEAP